jgi:hypothetical protein
MIVGLRGELSRRISWVDGLIGGLVGYGCMYGWVEVWTVDLG